MTAVIAGEVSPIVSGIVYCAVIEACQQLFDLRRAQEWTAALTRWLDVAARPRPVPGQLPRLSRRADAPPRRVGGRGRSRPSAPATGCRDRHPSPAVGEAIYELAELDRLRGAFEAAEAGYREAGSWGRLPEPGHALLRLAQGDVGAASTAIRRAHGRGGRRPRPRRGCSSPRSRSRWRPATSRPRATSADRLAAIGRAGRRAAPPGDGDSGPTARVRLAEGDVEGALARPPAGVGGVGGARRPVRGRPSPGPDRGRLPGARRRRWRGARSGRRPRRVRRGSGRRRTWPRLDAADRLPDAAAPLPGGLSAREVEVLRLVAAGLTNRAIADALTISERTVDRHVSNIFTKLDVSTRAAATAFAYEHGLV